MRFGLGCVPCPPDALGDCSLEEILGASVQDSVPAPARLDLIGLVKRIRSQGIYGTCVGFGFSQAACCCARQFGFEDFEDISALATYVQARALSKTLKRPGDGTTIDAAVRAVTKGGYVFETEYPYKPELRNRGFKLGMGQAALRKAGLRAHRIVDADVELAVRSLLANGRGVLGGWQVDKSFEDWTASEGPWNGRKGVSEGGHCMCVLDYPDGHPRLVNSWGEEVGEGGLWTITWNALREATSLWAVEFVP